MWCRGVSEGQNDGNRYSQETVLVPLQCFTRLLLSTFASWKIDVCDFRFLDQLIWRLKAFRKWKVKVFPRTESSSSTYFNFIMDDYCSVPSNILHCAEKTIAQVFELKTKKRNWGRTTVVRSSHAEYFILSKKPDLKQGKKFLTADGRAHLPVPLCRKQIQLG